MATLNQIAHAYADSVGKDFDVAYIERLKFHIRTYRAKYVRQEAERMPLNHAIAQSYVDTLVDVDEADTCVVTAGCKLKRSTNKVPTPVQIKGASPFSYVGPVLITCPSDIPFMYSPPAEIANADYSRFTKNMVRYFYRNGYLYTTNNCLRKYFRVTHVFENPVEAADMCNTAIACLTDDDEFPIGEHMLEAIYKEMRNAEMSMLPPQQEALIEKK